LAYDDQVINEADLKIPHSELLNRAFALMPLKDLAPNWRFPAPGDYYGKTAYELIQSTAFNPEEMICTDLHIQRRTTTTAPAAIADAI
jgi:7,8-dihydro-6-hydroxymethylpterin-pyrophosphokinase